VTTSEQPVTVAGKRAVVIGGTSGIGEAIALGFAADGADVVASSRTPERVAETAAEVRERGAETVEATCDVTDRDSLVALRDETVDALGGVDVLVVSASAISRTPLAEITDAEFDHVLDVQLDGVYRALQAFAPALRVVDGIDESADRADAPAPVGESAGSVIAISSLAAQLSMADLPAYSAAKGGTDALVRAAAKELGPAIRVNAIAPGFFLTDQNRETYAEGTEKRARIDERTPLGRVGETEELVGAATYLASDAASYTTGEVLTVDGGFARSAL
jgi:NAD(P)-dependent dehydrogenase (short-subunit alcohol dehydrogenase family)